MRILPFVPVVVALVAALVTHWYQTPAPPKSAAEMIGTRAPDFALHDAQEELGAEPVALSRLVTSGPVVIIFHRGLQCPVCYHHLSEIADRIADFKSAGIQVLAIGPDSLDDAQAFIYSYGGFPFPLLSDPDESVARAFGLQSPDDFIFDGAFVVDRRRRIHWAMSADEPVGTVPELLAAAKAAADAH